MLLLNLVNILHKKIFSNMAIAKAHEHGHTINIKQTHAMARFIEALANEVGVTAYEVDSKIQNKAKTITEL